MQRETRRTVGALLGLAIGWMLMLLLGMGGVTASFIFGVGGTLIGSTLAQRWKARSD